ncbi:peptide deformylase [Rathayibacter toxicus]|uniref:Peptide deformylase n=1 Tax=Rathayibacter toxicus TaxID=145458 RepID=A0A0C5BS77_9MICO|nr:peptide deformylase [Rathayibacter toxicus]AJM77517.1 peptide deformylase [Rathayibacter toxicus]ALS56567.1 peptide deformylase [Rathayibacter toxicus]KKM44661.1 peptide deformylase [Rathayibacter toxicus]PPG21606.1 peptide deformylase [Rathayibacter toxicus]PPG46568.1 peptide deformylase [Rathayibacter toxicus]
MAVLPIRISGEPVLHCPATAVTTFDDELRTLVADMFDTMDTAPGVGLAGPQVGVALRLFVYDYPADETPRRGVAINPELFVTPAPLGAADEDTEAEGCLSFPGERFPLRRPEKAILRASDLEGTPFEIVTEGWFARVLQHEFDHLNGILYTDRLEYEYHKQVAKIIRKRGWGTSGVCWTPGVDNLEG